MAGNKYGLEEMPIPVKINAPQECAAIFLGECQQCLSEAYAAPACPARLRKVGIQMEERTTVSKNHKLVVNNRKTSLVTGVLDVLSFDLNEVFLETEQGMLMVKGSDLHVNRLNLEKGEVDLSGTIDSIAYSDVQSAVSRGENIFAKLFR